MRCKRQGPPKQSRIVERAYKQPARCLSAFTTIPNGDVLTGINKRIECVNLQLACSCGSGEFEILGHPMASLTYPDQNIFAAVISLICQSCGKLEQLFDPDHDGYNGEIDSSAGVIGTGELKPFICPECGMTTFHPGVSLEYSIDDEEMEDWEELGERPQDFFTWFSLYGKCAKCGHVTEVTDYECA